MILDPQQFVSTEMSRHHAMAEALSAVPRRRRGSRRRGPVLRLAVWATGRAAQV